MLGQPEYLAVVAKAVDLSGSVSSPKGLREVGHQVLQCFDNPYEDLFGMTRVSIDRVWIVTSKRILSGAETSIFSSLEKNNRCILNDESNTTPERAQSELGGTVAGVSGRTSVAGSRRGSTVSV